MTMTVLMVTARPQVNFGGNVGAEAESNSHQQQSQVTDGSTDTDKVVDLRHYYQHYNHHHHGGYYNSYPYYNNYGYGGYGGYYGSCLDFFLTSSISIIRERH